MAPLEDDDAVLVGLHAPVFDDVHRHVRQWQERRTVVREQFDLPAVLAVVGFFGQPHAFVEQGRVEPLERPRGRDRHEQGTADGADLGLDIAFLMAGMGVAQRRVKAVMGAETAEHLGVAHFAGTPPPADARGVVEHDARRHAAQTGEQVLQGLAGAFGVLARRQARDGGVRMREREHEIMHAPAHALPVHVALAEIGLRLARMPRQVQKAALAFEAELTFELAHLARHGGQ